MLQRDKRGVSEVIGYILLISIAVALSVVVYTWLKSYVPTDKIECPEETSLMIKEISCAEEILKITFKNNGKFGVVGYYIRGSSDETKEIAMTDISKYTSNIWGKIVVLGEIDGEINNQNNFAPGDVMEQTFDVSTESLKFIEIIPVRNQEYNGKWKTVSCASKIRQEVTC